LQRGPVADLERARTAADDVDPAPVLDRDLVGGDGPAVERDDQLLGPDRSGRRRRGDLEGDGGVVDDLECEPGADLRASRVGRSSDGRTVTDAGPRGKPALAI